MGHLRRLPPRREFFIDQRGAGRALRVTTHPDQDVVVLSIWQDDRCTATFRLGMADCAPLIALLAAALGDQVAELRDGVLAGREASAEDG